MLPQGFSSEIQIISNCTKKLRYSGYTYVYTTFLKYNFMFNYTPDSLSFLVLEELTLNLFTKDQLFFLIASMYFYLYFSRGI